MQSAGATPLQSFLVSLGFTIDQQQLRSWLQSIQQAGGSAQQLATAVSSLSTRLQHQAAAQHRHAVATRSLTAGWTAVKTVALSAAGAIGTMGVAIEESVRRTNRQFEELFYLSQRTGVAVDTLKSISFGYRQLGQSADAAKAQIAALTSRMEDEPGLREYIKRNLLGGQEFKNSEDAIAKMAVRLGEILKIPGVAGRNALFQYRFMLQEAGVDADSLMRRAMNPETFQAAINWLAKFNRALGVTEESAQKSARAAVAFQTTWGEVAQGVTRLWEEAGNALTPAATKLGAAFSNTLTQLAVPFGELNRKTTAFLNSIKQEDIERWLTPIVTEFTNFVNRLDEDKVKRFGESVWGVANALWEVTKAAGYVIGQFGVLFSAASQDTAEQFGARIAKGISNSLNAIWSSIFSISVESGKSAASGFIDGFFAELERSIFGDRFVEWGQNNRKAFRMGVDAILNPFGELDEKEKTERQQRIDAFKRDQDERRARRQATQEGSAPPVPEPAPLATAPAPTRFVRPPAASKSQTRPQEPAPTPPAQLPGDAAYAPIPPAGKPADTVEGGRKTPVPGFERQAYEGAAPRAAAGDDVVTLLQDLKYGFSNWWSGSSSFSPLVTLSSDYYDKIRNILDDVLLSFGFQPALEGAGAGGGGGGGGGGDGGGGDGASRRGGGGGGGRYGGVRDPRKQFDKGSGADLGRGEVFDKAVKMLTDLGVKKEVAEGAVGYANINESKMDPNIVNPTSGALGIFQWLGARLRELKATYGDKPTAEQQIEFTKTELQGKEGATLKALLDATTQKEGYSIWGRNFERPGEAALAKAEAAYQRLGGRIERPAGPASAPAGASPTGAGETPIQDMSQTSGLPSQGEISAKAMIIHHTAMRGSTQDIIDKLKERGFSANYVIDRDGNIAQILPEGHGAAHMLPGEGKKGKGLSNRNTEGVEIIAKDDRDVTEAQIKAAQSLVRQRAKKLGYDPATAVFGHGEVNFHKQVTEGKTAADTIRDAAKNQATDANAKRGADSTSDKVQPIDTGGTRGGVRGPRGDQWYAPGTKFNSRGEPYSDTPKADLAGVTASMDAIKKAQAGGTPWFRPDVDLGAGTRLGAEPIPAAAKGGTGQGAAGGASGAGPGPQTDAGGGSKYEVVINVHGVSDQAGTADATLAAIRRHEQQMVRGGRPSLV